MKVNVTRQPDVPPPIDSVEISLSYDQAVCLARLLGRVHPTTEVGRMTAELWHSLKRVGISYTRSYQRYQGTDYITIEDEVKK